VAVTGIRGCLLSLNLTLSLFLPLSLPLVLRDARGGASHR
jgi:hypothetical protein